MGIFERLAYAIFRTATGNIKKRWILTPLIALFFFSAIVLFVIAALMTDRWLNLPSISFMPWTLVIAIIFLAAGITFYSWTMYKFLHAHGTPVPVNPPHELITGGIYAHIRNPMLSALYITFWGTGIALGSLSLTTFYTPLFIIINTIYIKKVEERELEMKFGQAYLNYKKRVPMYFPRIILKEKDI